MAALAAAKIIDSFLIGIPPFDFYANGKSVALVMQPIR
jgi:hypothetical protein